LVTEPATEHEDPTMTDEMMSLRALLEKSSDAELLREMVEFAAQRLDGAGSEDLTGAARGERSPARLIQRNGYRDRVWETSVGTFELRIPTLRRAATSLPSEPRLDRIKLNLGSSAKHGGPVYFLVLT